MAPKPIPVGTRASVSDAKQAYFEGDFERCLEICAAIRVGSVATASEVALLSARAYLRTGRPREAQAAVVDTLETHATLDASLTAQMLVASARIRQDDPDTGIAILLDAATRTAGAHFAVCSEIAFATALGYWTKRDIDAAEAYLAQVDPRSDIIHARALELQAWCDTARRDYRRSAEGFKRTLVRLEGCSAHDRAIAATAISTLAIYSAELFDAELARFVDRKALELDWSSGLSAQKYLTLFHQALYREFAGDTLGAYHFAALARDNAPTRGFEVFAWSMSSLIARNAGEGFTATLHAKRALELLESIDPQELVGEERFALLAVAETCAPFDPQTAAQLCTRYFGLAPVDRLMSYSSDVRLTADEAFITGVVAETAGDAERARACYREAYELFAGIGYRRRAVAVGHALLKIEHDDDVLRYVTAQLGATNNYITAWLRRSDAQPDPLERHPVVAALPLGQREVVALICQGKTNKEIARLRNVGEQTIKNMLSKHIFRAFGVSSRSALVSACLRERAAGF